MKIYIGHSREFDFQKELYTPIRESALSTLHEIILPHEKSEQPANTPERLQQYDLFVAEVTFPSTGLGIELGWANLLRLPIICIYKKGARYSN